MRNILSTIMATVAVLLLLGLAACAPAGSPDPGQSPTASQTPAPSAEVDSARYFFVRGSFLGSWDNGAWRSADRDRFTLGQIFNHSYISWLGDEPRAVRFYIGEGPGGFPDPETARRLLEPLGIVENGDFIMYLPGSLTGDAAALEVPGYGFFAFFDGQTHYLISNAPITPADLHLGYDGAPPIEQLLPLLREAGVRFHNTSVTWESLGCDTDGDGQKETLTLIRSAGSDDGELLVAEGDDIFYALLFTDGDQTSLVTLERIDYTENIAAHFSPGQPIAADLDGDGSCEIILQYRGWEWGHYTAFALEDGRWVPVLRAEYGT